MAKMIFFDLWNTLLYCPTRDRVTVMLKVLGLSPRMSYHQMISEMDSTVFRDCNTELRGVLKSLCEKHNVKTSDATITSAVKIWESRLSEAEPFPDVMPALEDLRKGYSLGLLSNTDKGGADFIKAGKFYESFDFAIMSCDKGCVKPSLSIYEEAAKAAGLPPSECWMVGDNLKADVEGAIKAGLNAVLIDRTGRQHTGDYHVVRHLTDLRRVIE